MHKDLIKHAFFVIAVLAVVKQVQGGLLGASLGTTAATYL